MLTKNKVEIKIQGREYTIVGTDPDEYIYKIGQYVDKKMSEIAAANSRLSIDMVGVLSCINIADELFKAQQSEGNIGKQLIEYSSEIGKLNEENKRQKAEIEGLREKLAVKESELANFLNKF